MTSFCRLYSWHCNGILNPPKKIIPQKLQPRNPKTLEPPPPPSPGIFYPHPTSVREFFDHHSIGGKKHENVILIQKLVQEN